MTVTGTIRYRVSTTRWGAVFWLVAAAPVLVCVTVWALFDLTLRALREEFRVATKK